MSSLRLARFCAQLTLIVCAALSFGQVERPIVGKPWKGPMGVKATMKQIAQWHALNGPSPYKFIVMPREREIDHSLLPGPKGVEGTTYPPRTNNSIDAASLITPQSRFSVSTSFDGGGFDDETFPKFVPPDTMGDVGPNNVVVVVNNWLKIWDRNGTSVIFSGHLNTFFNSVRNSAHVGDSRIRFDRLSGKWIITSFTRPDSFQNNRMVFAVSDTATISNSTVWTFFFFQHNIVTPAGDTNAFLDYPTLGVDSQALYIGANMFGGTAGFETSLFVVRKSSILGAGPIVVTAFRNLYNSNNGIYTPQGVDHDDPASTDGYVIGHGGHYNTLRMRKITDPGGTPVLQAQQAVSGMLNTNEPTSVPALGSILQLDGGDIRMLKAAIHTNALTGVKTLWTSGSVGVNAAGSTTSPNRAATRWYEVQNFSTTPSMRQAGTIFDSAASNPRMYWMGSAAMNRQGHAVVAMSMSSALDRASIAYVDRLSTDTLGTMRSPMTIIAGSAAYNLDSGDATYRWGDYSNTVVDPLDGMSIWTFQEYCNATDNWEVRVTKLLAPPPATPTTVSPNNPMQGSTATLTVTGTSSNGSGFFDPGAGFTNHLQASFSGTGVSVTAVRFTNPTTFEVDVTIAANAATGARTLTVTNPDGQTATLASAITIASGAPVLSSVTLPNPIGFGATVTGTVNLSKAAQAGGALVTLSSSSASLTVPANVTVPAGSSSVNFSATAATVTESTPVTVTASFDGVDKTVNTEIHTSELSALSLNRTTIIGGSASTGVAKVTLATAAPANLNIPVSANSGLINIPATIKVLAGATTGQVVFNAPTAVSTSTVVTITANWQGVQKSQNISVLPPAPSKLVFSPAILVGGSATTVTGTVTLSQVAPAGGVVVTLECASLLLTVPATVTVPAGSTEGTFTIGHKTVPTQKIISVQAFSGGVKKANKVTLNPPGIASITCDPKSLVGGVGASLIATVTLNAPAATGGQDVALTLSSGEITVPATVHFNQTQQSRTFTITAPQSVQNNVTVTITGTLNGTKTLPITVVAPKVASVSVNPNSVVGGSATSVVFTVNLTAPAPAGGYVVTLASNNTSAATMPATVTVPAGATSANVAVTHFDVGTTVTASLSATANASTKSVSLQVKA